LLNNVGKNFNRDWIFKNVNLNLTTGDILAITGSNGSGKSTLLQLMCAYLTPSEGEIKWHSNKNVIGPELVYQHFSISSPALQLVEDFKLTEMLCFYFRFKKIKNNLSQVELLKISGLENHAQKRIKDFSSGMKQRLKLLLAFASDTAFLLLDEPCSNLDRTAIEWYKTNFKLFSEDRTIIVCSNNTDDELFMCNKSIAMEDFKN
jgi:ABC-type multidrug transport system ATPase subunit